ncbi:MAG: hypothetical protein RQ757_08400 [Pseudomonadales bacterium]|nr:hypothetical protein [Pseudomonadales bacterium]
MPQIISSMLLFCVLAYGVIGTVGTIFPAFAVSPFHILSQAQAQTQTEPELSNEPRTVRIIRLQHRDTESISNAIRPLLANGASLGQMDNALILASTAANLNEIEQIISQLDIPRRFLLVSVDFNYQPAYSTGNNQLRTETATEGQIQRLRLLEGEQAVVDQIQNQISTGVNVFNPGLTIQEEQMQSRRLILLSAEVIDEQIILSMDVLTEDRNNQTGSTRRLTTRIPIEPGEWLVINPADEPAGPDNVTSLSTRNSTRNDEALIAVNVELQP